MPRKTKKEETYNITIDATEDLLNLPARDPVNENPFMPRVCGKMLLIGPSEAGKSTIIINIILKGVLTWVKLYIFSKSIDDVDYEGLFEELTYRFENAKLDINEYVEAYSDLKDLPDVETFDPEIKHLVIIDDFGNDPMLNSNDFTNWMDVCRHRNVQIIIVSHRFIGFAPQIRIRCKQFAFMRGSLPGKSDVSNAHQNIGDVLDIKTFTKMYKTATSRQFEFFYIDLTCNDLNKRFRQGFDKPFLLSPSHT